MEAKLKMVLVEEDSYEGDGCTLSVDPYAPSNWVYRDPLGNVIDLSNDLSYLTQKYNLELSAWF